MLADVKPALDKYRSAVWLKLWLEATQISTEERFAAARKEWLRRLLRAWKTRSTQLIVRRLVQIEVACKKNPKTRDYTGLEGLLESAVDGSGAAVVPKLSQWLGESQNNEAFVLKQMRLWSEKKKEIAKKK